VLLNVAVPDPGLLSTASAVWSAVAEEEASLGAGGRVLLRPSGTEPLVRVMVEATGDGVAEAIAQRLSALVRHELQAAATPPGRQAK
jgi:phosphoglucosamine mutase